MKISRDSKLYIRNEVEKRIPPCSLRQKYTKSQEDYQAAVKDYRKSFEAEFAKITEDLSHICGGDTVVVKLDVCRCEYPSSLKATPTMLEKVRAEEKARQKKIDDTVSRIIGELEINGSTKDDLRRLLAELEN